MIPQLSSPSFQAIPQETTQHEKPFIALDIDGILVLCTCDEVPARRAQAIGKLCYEKGAVVIAHRYAYYLLPGAIEFLEWIHAKPQVQVVYISAGTKQRNEELLHTVHKNVPSLRDKAIQILSKEDLIDGKHPHFRSPNATSQLLQGWYSNLQKDLSRIPGWNPTNPHGVLIEDNPGNMALGQEKHLLYVPSSTLEEVCFLGNLKDVTHSWCTIIRVHNEQEFDSYKKRLNDGEVLICALLGPKEIRLGFSDHNRFKEVSLAPPEHCQNSITWNKDGSLIDHHSKLGQTILHTIEDHGGTTETLFHFANRIFYITGAVFHMLQQWEERKIPVQDTASMHTERLLTHKMTYPMSKLPCETFRDSVYKEGLRILRHKHPGLSWITPVTYRQSQHSPTSFAIQRILSRGCNVPLSDIPQDSCFLSKKWQATQMLDPNETA